MWRGGRDPTRRSRKIGTRDRAWNDRVHGTANFRVPWPTWTPDSPLHPGGVRVERQDVHDFDLPFAIEPLRAGCIHACTTADVAAVLNQLPADDVWGLTLVVMSQPTRKEMRLHPIWGAIRWCVGFAQYEGPGILLAAADLADTRTRWGRHLSPVDRGELERFRETGFAVETTRRGYEIIIDAESTRRWLLTRTLPHEVGHWVDFKRRVMEPTGAESMYEAFNNPGADELVEKFYRRPLREREEFADRYATEAKVRC